jgi:hypothetical protein
MELLAAAFVIGVVYKAMSSSRADEERACNRIAHGWGESGYRKPCPKCGRETGMTGGCNHH